MNEITFHETKDHEGYDEWALSIFDANGDHSESVFDFPMGTFAVCVQEAANYISQNNTAQHRVVIERVM
jgi:hypothetical protein